MVRAPPALARFPAGTGNRLGVGGLRLGRPHARRRGGSAGIIAAELLGDARLETTRAYTRPSAEDRSKAVDLLP